MADLKNQHFVPRCLLRPFTHQGEGRAISLYNIRHDRLIERAPVKGQCARDYLYGKDGKIEKSLSEFEGLFSAARARIIAGGYDEEDLHNLRFFSFLQLRRTEMAVQRLKEAYELAGTNIFEDADKPKVPSNHGLVLRSLYDCMRTRKYIFDLKIRLIENRADVDFCISDDPAVFINRYAAQKLGETGFGVSTTGLILTMPLSAKFAVIAYDGQAYTVPDIIQGRIVIRDSASVESLNELQFLKAGENIYFSRWGDREYVRNEFLAKKDDRPESWSTMEFLVPDPTGLWHHDGQQYRVGTRDEAKKAGVAIMKMSIEYPVPKRWFPPLKFRGKIKTFYEGTGVGHVRKAEWLKGPVA